MGGGEAKSITITTRQRPPQLAHSLRVGMETQNNQQLDTITPIYSKPLLKQALQKHFKDPALDQTTKHSIIEDCNSMRTLDSP